MIWIGYSLMALLIIGGFVGWRLEVRDWNGGYCRCGNKWEYFDTNSQGGRGYKCRDCGAYVWISWPRVDSTYESS